MSTIRRSTRLSRAPEVSPAVRLFLETGDWKSLPDGTEGIFELAQKAGPRADQVDDLREDWQRVGETLVAEWSEARPGTRPWGWWQFAAPERRRRLGGIGDDYSAAPGWWQSWSFGLPTRWVDPHDVAYYNGRATDIHGRPIGAEYHAGNFPYDAIDATNPPIFESQAAYLDRRGLLSASERQRLSADAFEPEAIENNDDDTEQEIAE